MTNSGFRRNGYGSKVEDPDKTYKTEATLHLLSLQISDIDADLIIITKLLNFIMFDNHKS